MCDIPGKSNLVSAATKAINDAAPSVLQGGGDLIKNVVGNVGWDQDAYDRESEALAKAEDDRAKLEDLRTAQGDYEASQTPGLGTKILSGLGISSHALDEALGTRTSQARDISRMEDLRKAQGEYEASQKGGQLEKAYGSALGGQGTLGTLARYAGAAAPLIGEALGYGSASGLRDQSQQAYKDMLAAAGQQVQVGPSAAENLQDSQQDLAARAKAMGIIQQRAEMGLTPEDKAMLQQARASADQQAQSQFAKSQTDLARRGMSQSPALMLAQAQGAGQDAAARQQAEAQNIAQQSFAAKQAAAQQLAQQAGTNLQQDFSRGLSKAQNMDQIARFNAEQQAARAGRMQQAGAVQGSQLGQAAGAKAGAFAGMGKSLGQASESIFQNQPTQNTAQVTPKTAQQNKFQG